MGRSARAVARIVIRVRVGVIGLILPEQVTPRRPRGGHRYVPAPQRHGRLVPREGVEPRGRNGGIERRWQPVALGYDIVEEHPLHVVVVAAHPRCVSLGFN